MPTAADEDVCSLRAEQLAIGYGTFRQAFLTLRRMLDLNPGHVIRPRRLNVLVATLNIRGREEITLNMPI
jgi:hypothetical protein